MNMRGYTIVVNGKSYEVDICERETDGEMSISSVAPSAPAPVAAPVPSAKAAPAPAAPKAAPVPAGEGNITAPMPGTVLSIAVKEGDNVSPGTILVILEAMKMENEIVSPCVGVVKQIVTTKGATVNSDDLLIVIG